MGFQQDDHNEVSPCIRGLGDLHKTSNVHIKRMVRSNGNLNTEHSIPVTRRLSECAMFLFMIVTKGSYSELLCGRE